MLGNSYILNCQAGGSVFITVTVLTAINLPFVMPF